MDQIIFLAECMDKKHHSEDFKTVTKLKKITGIDDAFETHVRFKGKEYCIAAISHVGKKQHKGITQKIRSDTNVKSVQMLSEKDVPF